VVGALRRPAFVTSDSESFLKALDLWSDWLALDLQTPRAFKRFSNKVRFLAMTCRQDVAVEPTVRWRERLSALYRRNESPRNAQEAALDQISPGIVAFAAILELQPKWNSTLIRAAFVDPLSPGAEQALMDVWTDSELEVKELLNALRQFLAKHNEVFPSSAGVSWLPSEETCRLIEEVIGPR
jgi:hypothetical protein